MIVGTKTYNFSDVIFDTIKDCLNILPFLFLAFLIIEIIEHKLNNKSKNILQSSKKMGPILGSICGIFPQCGFSVVASNLYMTRIITLGTLIATYLTTSDEMLPILIANRVSFKTILMLLSIKFVAGIIWGFIIDFLVKKKKKKSVNICHDDNCHCENSIFKSSFIHTGKNIL